MKLPSWSAQTVGAAFVAFVVMALFSFGWVWALLHSIDKLIDTLTGVLLTSVGIIVKWFYDSSASSHAKDDTISKMADNTQTALLTTPPASTSTPPMFIPPK